MTIAPDATSKPLTTTTLWRASLAVPLLVAVLAVLYMRLTASPGATSETPPEPLTWTRVASDRYVEGWASSGQGAVAVSEMGILARSADNGATWTEREIVVASDEIPAYMDLPAIPAQPILEETPGVAIAPDGAIVLVGGMEESADSTLLRSTDGGRTWVRAPNLEAGLLTSLAFAAGAGIATGPAGIIARTTDNGATWSRVTTPTDLDLFSVSATESGKVLVAGEQGVVLRSDDGGRRFAGAVFGRQPLYAVALGDDGRGWVAGSAGTILATSDGGRTFRSVGAAVRQGASRLPAFASIEVVERSGSPLVIVGGEGGLVLVGRGDGAWSETRLPDEDGLVTGLLDMGTYVLASTSSRHVYRAELEAR